MITNVVMGLFCAFITFMILLEIFNTVRRKQLLMALINDTEPGYRARVYVTITTDGDDLYESMSSKSYYQLFDVDKLVYSCNCGEDKDMAIELGKKVAKLADEYLSKKYYHQIWWEVDRNQCVSNRFDERIMLTLCRGVSNCFFRKFDMKPKCMRRIYL